MFLSPTADNEVDSTIKELQDKKATGPNDIPCKISKNNKDVISKPLCDLINLVLVSGTFPQRLKTAKTISVAQIIALVDFYCLYMLRKAHLPHSICIIF